MISFLGERHYETHWFKESVERVLIDDHNVPRLRFYINFYYLDIFTHDNLLSISALLLLRFLPSLKAKESMELGFSKKNL